MKGKLVHAGQRVQESMESGGAQPTVAPHVGTVGTHALGAVVVNQPAAPRFWSHVGRTEVVDHHHHHDEGDGHRRTYHTHRGIEAVLAQQTEVGMQVV